MASEIKQTLNLSQQPIDGPTHYIRGFESGKFRLGLQACQRKAGVFLRVTMTHKLHSGDTMVREVFLHRESVEELLAKVLGFLEAGEVPE